MSVTLTSEFRPQLKWHVGAAEKHGRVNKREFLRKSLRQTDVDTLVPFRYGSLRITFSKTLWGKLLFYLILKHIFNVCEKNHRSMAFGPCHFWAPALADKFR